MQAKLSVNEQLTHSLHLNNSGQRKHNCEHCDITEKRRSTISASFQKLCPGIKTPKKDELIILGSPLGPKSQADLVEKKTNELEKVNGVVEKLNADYVFLC